MAQVRRKIGQNTATTGMPKQFVEEFKVAFS
jgi:hypothetical protein